MTLRDAIARCKAATPDTTLCVTTEVWVRDYGTQVTFAIFGEHQQVVGETMAQAVALYLAKFGEPGPGDVDEAELLMAEAEDNQA